MNTGRIAGKTNSMLLLQEYSSRKRHKL